MDDLLADDIKQGEQATSVVARSNTPFSGRGSSGQKRQQLSDLGGDNKGLVSIQLNPFGADSIGLADSSTLAIKKRDVKQQEKHQTQIQQTLFQSLGPANKESPLIGPLAGKFSSLD